MMHMTAWQLLPSHIYMHHFVGIKMLETGQAMKSFYNLANGLSEITEILAPEIFFLAFIINFMVA